MAKAVHDTEAYAKKFWATIGFADYTATDMWFVKKMASNGYMEYANICFDICSRQLDDQEHDDRETYSYLLHACEYEGGGELVSWLCSEIGEETVGKINEDFEGVLETTIRHFRTQRHE